MVHNTAAPAMVGDRGVFVWASGATTLTSFGASLWLSADRIAGARAILSRILREIEPSQRL